MRRPLSIIFRTALVFAALALVQVPEGKAFISLMVNTVAGSTVDQPDRVVLDSPEGLAVDANDTLYIADSGNNVIRILNASTGLMNTVAGTHGLAGYSGDGGAATSALMNSPVDVALDSAGNLYIVDMGNNMIRMVDALTGVISNVAGTGEAGFNGNEMLAVSARLNAPQGLFVTPGGDVYLSDTWNELVRIANATDSNISNIAGQGTSGYSGDGGPATDALLSSPIGLDMTGDSLYIADTSNNAVRMVNTSTGMIKTVAGTGFDGSSGDGGAATDADLYLPLDVALDATGNLYIADNGNDTIRMVDTSGTITTVAGQSGVTGDSGDGELATDALLNSPGGLAINSTGALYISDSNNKVRMVSGGNIYFVAGNNFNPSVGDGGAATDALLYRPSGLAYDENGNIYISDFKGHQVRFVNTTTGIITTVMGTGTQGFGGDDGLATDALLSGPAGIAYDNGVLYIADSGNNRIRSYDTFDKNARTVVGNGTCNLNFADYSLAVDAQLCTPVDVDMDSSGNIYILEGINNVVRKVLKDTMQVFLFAGEPGVSGYSGDGGVPENARLSSPMGIAINRSTDDVYIADTGNQIIRMVIYSSGLIYTYAGTQGVAGYTGDGGAATSALMNNPEAVAITPQGEVLVSDTLNHVIRYIDPRNWIINTLAGGGVKGFGEGDGETARLNHPTAIIATAANTVYFADEDNERVRWIEISNRWPSVPVLLSPSDGATGVAVDVTFQWEESVDLDGDTMTYTLYVCNLPSSECTTTVIASAKPVQGVMYAGSFIAFAFAGIALMEGRRGFRRRTIMALALAILLAAFAVSCGGGTPSEEPPSGELAPWVPPPWEPPSEDPPDGESDPDTPDPPAIINTVTELDPQSYYWRVEATDGTVTVASETWSFTTE